MLSGPEIQDALRSFVARWRDYSGSERAEAQTFLNQLFECYGSSRQDAGALFEDFKSSSGFMDLHWPGVVIFEMKAPGVPPYSIGVLMSRSHDAWAWSQSSTLETRLRYTPSSVFETFPWPDPSEAIRAAVAAAASALYERRTALCLEHQLGLTKIYNLMDDGAFADLRELHRKLDVAVAAAYGWPASIAQDGHELVNRLTELNRRIAIGEIDYNPFNRADITL